jgi:FtsH-binding integral membrane protein
MHQEGTGLKHQIPPPMHTSQLLMLIGALSMAFAIGFTAINVPARYSTLAGSVWVFTLALGFLLLVFGSFGTAKSVAAGVSIATGIACLLASLVAVSILNRHGGHGAILFVFPIATVFLVGCIFVLSGLSGRSSERA